LAGDRRGQKKNEADVAVSAGNHRALMAMARFCLRMRRDRTPGYRRDLADPAAAIR